MTENDRDILAAEYVLGTLSGEERTAFAEDINRDPATRALVTAWEERLGALEDSAGVVEPTDGLFAAIEAQLDAPIPLADGSVTIRAEDDLWVTVREGLDRKYLFRDEAKGVESFLLRYAPGTRVGAHTHTSVEECFLLEGDLRLGDVDMKPGDFHAALPGTEHSSGLSVGGAILLVRIGIR
jgi:quercetin dioxygenase-like cupin family protein